jgi:hypothetical protein
LQEMRKLQKTPVHIRQKWKKNDHTKNLFYDEMISISWSIYVVIFMKMRDKIFFLRKNTKGVCLQVFLGPPKKKYFFYKSCR